MGRHLAFLRAVNVGRVSVKMAELRGVFETLGFARPQTVLQSGNVVFDGGRAGGPALERRIEAALLERLSLATDVLVRTADEWASVVARNPFPELALDDPAHLVVTVMRDAPSAATVTALQAAIVGRERVTADGRHLYVTYPDGIGDSKLTNALIERRLGTRGTGRNWNTVLRLARLTDG